MRLGRRLVGLAWHVHGPLTSKGMARVGRNSIRLSESSQAAEGLEWQAGEFEHDKQTKGSIRIFCCLCTDVPN